MDQLKLPIFQDVLDENERLRRENIELRRRLGLSADEPILEPAVAEPLQPESDGRKLPTGGARQADQAVQTALTTADKLNIFNRLFRARHDIYAVRKKAKSGRYNYYPAKQCDWSSHTFDPARKRYQCSDHCRYLTLTDTVI